MRTVVPARLEEGRFRNGAYGSDASYDLEGAFHIIGPHGQKLLIVSSGVDREFGWEHVSVSTDRRTPNWTEMCFVKDLFWGEEECVVQFHPPRSKYVNCHPYCLHLWKPVDMTVPLPPPHLVGSQQNLEHAND